MGTSTDLRDVIVPLRSSGSGSGESDGVSGKSDEAGDGVVRLREIPAVKIETS